MMIEKFEGFVGIGTNRLGGIHVSFNGPIYAFTLRLGRLFEFTIWEKKF